MYQGQNVRATVSGTKKQRDVTLRRDASFRSERSQLYQAPAYTHVNGKTVSGILVEVRYGIFSFRPTGKYAKLLN